MSDYIISQLPSDVQRFINERGLDRGGPRAAPDGRLNAADLEGLRAALAAEASPEARRLLQSLEQAVTDGLHVPRSEAAGVRLASAIDPSKSRRPWDAISKLSEDDLRGATVQERASMLRHIVQGTGYGQLQFIASAVDGDKEARALQIIESTPEHQKPELMRELSAQGIVRRLLSSVDGGSESARLRSFLNAYVWAAGDAQEVAQAVRSLGIADESALLGLVYRMRPVKGDRFTDDVLVGLINAGALRQALPSVYWRAPVFTCTSQRDVARAEGWRGMLQQHRAEHGRELTRLLGALPPGHAGALLRRDFDEHHDVERLAAGISAAACSQKLADEAEARRLAEIAAAAAAALAAQEAAARREREAELEREAARARAATPPSTPATPAAPSTPAPAPERRTRLGGGMGRDSGVRQTPAPATAPQQQQQRGEGRRQLGGGMGRESGVRQTPAPAPAPQQQRNEGRRQLGGGMGR